MTIAAPSSLRQRKKERTRRTIIDVGTTLFAEQGYDKTTVAQIADAAEIAPSTFFNYFSSKADIVFGSAGRHQRSARDFMLGAGGGQAAQSSGGRVDRRELPESRRRSQRSTAGS